MAGVNKVILMGNLGKDPEIRTLESGAKVARISLATNEYFKNKNGEVIERTEWHFIVLWHRKAELAEKFLKRGSPLYVEGRLQTRNWEDKDGVKRYTTEIVADVVNLVGGKQPTNGPLGPDNPPDPGNGEIPPEEDDLPF